MAFANVTQRQLSPAAQYGAIANRGQAGGTRSVPSSGKLAAFRENQRKKFFDNRKDISNQRIDDRTKQEGIVRQFKDSLIRNDRVLKDSKGNPVLNTNTGEPVFLTDVPGGRSVSDVTKDLATRFGPTLEDIGGDISFGLGRIADSFAQKGAPIVQLFKGIGEKFKGGVEQLWDKVRGEAPTQVGTAFPQPGSDAKNLFSSINTGIAEVDPNNLLVQIAMANQGRFDDKPAFEDQLANATAMDFNTLLPQPIQNLQNKVSNLGNTKIGQFGLDNVLSLQPTATFNTDVFGGQLGITANPFKDQYGFQFTKAFNKGGSVDKNSGLGYMLK